MATCPNKNLDSWNQLVAARGNDIAYFLWDIYEGEVPQEEYIPTVKPGVASVFSSTPELAEIGDEEEYSAYLDTIFPDSQVKDILYHGSKATNIEVFKKPFSEGWEMSDPSNGTTSGIFFTPSKRITSSYIGEDGKGRVYQAILDVKSPYTIVPTIEGFDEMREKKFGSPTSPNEKRLKAAKKDSIILPIKYNVNGEKVTKNDVTVFDPEQIHILGSAKDIEGFRKFVATNKSASSATSYQKKGPMRQSVASEQALEKLKKIAEKMGVPIQKLSDYMKSTGLKRNDITGLADLVRRVIAIADGKEGQALTEEVVHVATAMIEIMNPSMVTEMISKIDRFAIYKEVLEAYKNDPDYQLPNGKPDIRKIKKEAVDKLIAEVIINSLDNSQQYPELLERENLSMIRRWWNAIMDFINGQYRKTDMSLFEEAAQQIITGDIGTVDQLQANGVFYQKSVTAAQEQIIKNIEDTKNLIKKKYSDEKADPILLDTEEATNWYENQASAKKIANRVTDRVKAWYNKKFPKKEFTDIEKKFNELKRTYGIAGHLDLEEIHRRYFNEDGTRRTKPLEAPSQEEINLPSYGMYEELENYYLELIDTLDKDTLILSEVVIYDPIADEAGTIDFLAIEPSGKTHILDWKFMHIKNDQDDVAWFKQGAFGIQLSRYRQILREQYGVEDFGMVRAIPIAMEFKRKDRKDPESDLRLSSISIGDVDASRIDVENELYLLPVSEELESTGDTDLDEVVADLVLLYKMTEQEEVKEEDRDLRKERLALLSRAIRITQTAGDLSELVQVIRNIRNTGERIINEYNLLYKDRDVFDKSLTDKQLSEFSDEMRLFIKTSDRFKDVAVKLGNLIYTDELAESAKTKEEKKQVAERKRVLEELTLEASAIARTQQSVKKLLIGKGGFGDKYIGWRNLVGGLMDPEAVIKGISSWFRGVSDLGSKSLQILFKVTQAAENKASKDGIALVNELLEIRKELMEGGNVMEKIRSIYQKDDEGKRMNNLVYVYTKEFREAVDKNANDPEGGDKNWLLNNIDVEAYKKEAAEVLDRQIKSIERNNPGNDDETIKRRKFLIEQQKRKYDIDRVDFDGWNNYIVKRHPLEKWYSEEYKRIMQDPGLLKLYNFIEKVNNIAAEEGYISNMIKKTFLPFVAKTMAEEVAFDGVGSAIANFYENLGKIGDDLRITSKDVGLGEINQFTQQIENGIPKYYTKDFTKKEAGDTTDFSQISEDIFANLVLYIQHVQKYKYLKEVSGQLKLLSTIEEFKGHLQTTRLGDVVTKEDGTPVVITTENKENTETYDNFYKALVLQQRYPLSDADTAIGNPMNIIKRLINKAAGREVYKENPTPLSAVKTMEKINKWYQLKALGLDPFSGLANLFGANIQMSALAGTYFKSREFLSSEADLMSGIFQNEESAETFVQLMETFMPLKDSPFKKLYEEAGISALTRANLGDMLMFFMRKPEEFIDKAVFLTLMKNSMVVDGNIVNIKQYVSAKYQNRADSSALYRESKKKINEEIEELKKTKSMWVTKRLENGKLVIPGLDLNNLDETQRLTNLSRNIARSITGNLSNGDINKAGMNIWARSAMVFQNWIPRLVDVRFSEFKKTSDDFSVRIDPVTGKVTGERYDIGRLRLLTTVWVTSVRDLSSNITNILTANEKGMAIIDELFLKYKKEWKDRTGTEMNMSKADFTDMIVNNLRNQIKELGILFTLMTILFTGGFGLIAPDDDDDKATKNAKRYTERMLNKFTDELSFFYNPMEIERILSGDKLPALGLFADVFKFAGQLGQEITGQDFDAETTPEEVRKKVYPIKTLMKLTPGFKPVINLGASFSNDFAKEFDITIQAENNMR
jgi:hypothetical protein